MKILKRPVAIMLAGLIMSAGSRAWALPINEFRKFSSNDQATYIVAAVSMLAYSYAANGHPAKARCIQSWYFGRNGAGTPGPHAVESELGVAETVDAAKYHVEGIILGVADKACSAASEQ